MQPNKGGSFTFNEKNHDKGEKTVLGVTIPAGGGKEDGEKVLDILARHPSTASLSPGSWPSASSPTILRRC